MGALMKPTNSPITLLCTAIPKMPIAHKRLLFPACKTATLFKTFTVKPNYVKLIKKLKKRTAMIKHVIIWKLTESVENKEETMKSIKSALEGLTGKIDGLEKMLILTDKLPSS